MEIAGKTAVLTGAANGIGRGTAVELARRGAKLVLVDLDGDTLNAVAGQIVREGGEALPLTLDVGAEDAFDTVHEQAHARFGQVDILMNNVGILVSGLPQDIPLKEWERLLNINLMALIRANHRFIPEMVARGSGHIVNTASFAGLFPYAYDRLPYAASKGAIVAMSEGLALYLKPRGVGVTLLCPGPVATAIGKTMRSYTEGLALRGPGAQFDMKSPEEVAIMVAEAIEQDRFFVPTDDKVRPILAERGADPEAFLLRQLQQF